MAYGKENFSDAVKEWKLIHTGDAGYRQIGDGADHNQKDWNYTQQTFRDRNYKLFWIEGIYKGSVEICWCGV